MNVVSDYLTATIQIRDDIPEQPTGDWERTIIHELVHVRIGRLTNFVEEELFIELGSSHQQAMRRQFRREVEPVVQIMSEILYNLKNEQS